MLDFQNYIQMHTKIIAKNKKHIRNNMFYLFCTFFYFDKYMPLLLQMLRGLLFILFFNIFIYIQKMLFNQHITYQNRIKK